MVDLRYSATAAAAIKGVDTVMLIAPERALRKGWITRAVDAPWTKLLAHAAKNTNAGPHGTTVSAQNPGAGPKTIHLTVLPDERSRHNCPARPEEIAAAVEGANLGAKAAVIACVEAAEHILPVARAVGRALPTYTRKRDAKKSSVKLAVAGAKGEALRISKADKAIVDRARWAAILVDTPPQEMTTTAFVTATRRAARGVKNLKVSVISGQAVLDKKMGGLHAVGRTAVHPPRLLLLEYRPAKSRRTLGIIGKGIVYDTGGLSLKVGGHMAGMKCDMGGAAAAVGAALALADAGHKDAFVCAAALAENAIGPKAYRPDDILRMHSGKTVEVNNTDAEGRLVLADACSYVARVKKVDMLVDLATLTGAQLIATGDAHAGCVSNRAGLEEAVRAAGISSGDLAFPMPFAPEMYQREFRSKVADMKNSVANRMNAQSACAGQFIYSHIDDLDIPWLHVDLAGPAFRGERGTGYGVALVATLARQITNSTLKS